MNALFRKFAQKASIVAGSPVAFATAVICIAGWGLSGRLFNYSNTWQLFVNTGTTILTFLMIFLIQNTQNRDARAMHLKLDELIRAVRAARNKLVDLEDMSDDELNELQNEFHEMRERISEIRIKKKR